MQLTQQDGEEIRAALVAWLKQSQLGDRDELLAMTERAAIWEGADSLLNIGRWGVFADADRLIAKLRLRTAHGEGMAFDAPIAREGGTWKVREITPVHLHPRR